MITRRQLISSGAATVGGLAALCGAHGARAATEARAPVKLPASIERLQSRKHEAVPITRDERRSRHERARKLMSEQGLDAILLADGTSLDYFTGVRWWGSERFFAAVIPAKGEPFYVCPAFEEGRAREQLEKGPAGKTPDVRTWQEDESPYQRLAEGIRDRGLATGRIGVEETVRFVFTDAATKAAPNAHLVSATGVTAGCRMHKSQAEIALMRLAAQVTLAAYEATYRAIVPGVTQVDVNAWSRTAHERLGFEGAADLVLVGEYSAFPHGSVEPTQVREGSIVLLDGGCKVEGYCSDITRTFVIGKATPKMNSVFDIVHRAQAAALAAAKPGVECGAIDAAARRVVTEGGYGPDYRYFTHRLGHGMGMDGHEWPYLVRGNTTRLAANMTTSNEPGIYIRGEFGIRLEDDMHVTENGAELFTPTSKSLEEPFVRG
jgi:Xaa-Pro dipeptidase